MHEQHPIPEVPAIQPGRRSFLGWLAAIIGSVAALVLGLPLVGYLLSSLRKPKTAWVNLGIAARFPAGETRLVTFDNPVRQPWDGVSSQTGVYVRSQGNDAPGKERFLVFAINCTHLGCPVSWFPQSGLFMCPCHGGVYYENGERASGPPPRGLYHCIWKVENGNLFVQAPHLPTLQDTLEKPGGDLEV